MKNFLTKFIITNNPSYKVSQKQKAASMLLRFKWNLQQKQILEIIAAKGYHIGIFNEVCKVFGKPIATNGDKKLIMGISIGKRKSDFFIYAN